MQVKKKYHAPTRHIPLRKDSPLPLDVELCIQVNADVDGTLQKPGIQVIHLQIHGACMPRDETRGHGFLEGCHFCGIRALVERK